MKKPLYILTILVFFLTTAVFSQHTKVSKDKIRAYKIARITEKLNLSEKEAQQFWPIYNSHEIALEKLRKEESSSIKKLFVNGNNIDNISESKAKEIMASIESRRDKMHSINQEYFKKLKKIFTYKKILKLKVAEREFKRHLFDKMRKRRKILKKEKQ